MSGRPRDRNWMQTVPILCTSTFRNAQLVVEWMLATYTRCRTKPASVTKGTRCFFGFFFLPPLFFSLLLRSLILTTLGLLLNSTCCPLPCDAFLHGVVPFAPCGIFGSSLSCLHLGEPITWWMMWVGMWRHQCNSQNVIWVSYRYA